MQNNIIFYQLSDSVFTISHVLSTLECTDDMRVGGRTWLVTESVFLHSPDKGFWHV